MATIDVDDATGYATNNLIDRFVWKCGKLLKMQFTWEPVFSSVKHAGNSNLIGI